MMSQKSIIGINCHLNIYYYIKIAITKFNLADNRAIITLVTCSTYKILHHIISSNYHFFLNKVFLLHMHSEENALKLEVFVTDIFDLSISIYFNT